MLASCPADRWLLAATCCTPSWPPLLPALSCACARRAMVLSSQATVELRPSRWLQRCSVPAFWFLHVLHAPDMDPLATFLGDCRTETRAFALMPRPCWLPELRPCSLHTTYAEAQAAGSLSPRLSARCRRVCTGRAWVYTTKRSVDAGLAQRCIVFLQSYHACCPDLSSYWRPTLTGLPVSLPLIVMFATVQAGLGLYLPACCHPCRHGYHEPEASGFNAFVFIIPCLLLFGC